MKQFFLDMFSSNNKASSKRFAAIVVLLNLIAMAYIATFKSKDGITPEFMYNALTLIVVGGLGLTTIESFLTGKHKPTKPKQEEEPQG